MGERIEAMKRYTVTIQSAVRTFAGEYRTTLTLMAPNEGMAAIQAACWALDKGANNAKLVAIREGF